MCQNATACYSTLLKSFLFWGKINETSVNVNTTAPRLNEGLPDIDIKRGTAKLKYVENIRYQAVWIC